MRNVEVSRGEDLRQLYGAIGPARRTGGRLKSLAKVARSRNAGSFTLEVHSS
jgi:hypothetical protein